MTILVGIKCKNGIVIGSDSSATFGSGQIRTIEQKTKKIEILHGKIIVAGTGQIGLGQRFCDTLGNGYAAGGFKTKNGVQMGAHICHLVRAEFGTTSAPLGQYGSLVAYPADHDIHLCEFAISDLQPELKTTGLWYASMGSGQLIADPFLGLMRSVFWEQGMPNLEEGIFIATWALQHAIDVNAGGVNGPIQMAVLTNEKGTPSARMLTPDELNEHQENVTGAVSHLRTYRCKLAGKGDAAVPAIPSTPPSAVVASKSSSSPP